MAVGRGVLFKAVYDHGNYEVTDEVDDVVELDNWEISKKNNTVESRYKEFRYKKN